MTRITMGRLILAAAGVAALAGLGGCSGSEPEAPTNNVQQEVPAPQAAAPKPVVVAPPAENAAEPVAVPAEKPVAADQQMMDDASATGMTSHVSRDQEPANAE
jgi:hypothetical protein